MNLAARLQETIDRRAMPIPDRHLLREVHAELVRLQSSQPPTKESIGELIDAANEDDHIKAHVRACALKLGLSWDRLWERYESGRLSPVGTADRAALWRLATQKTAAGVTYSKRELAMAFGVSRESIIEALKSREEGE